MHCLCASGPPTTSSSLTLPSVRLADAGKYTVNVSNAYGFAVSPPTLVILRNQQHKCSITSTVSATRGFVIGQRVTFNGLATDVEDGSLKASAFRWRVTVHRGGGDSPALGAPLPLSPAQASSSAGSKSVSVVVSDSVVGSSVLQAANLSLCASLNVTDAGGSTSTAVVCVPARVCVVTVAARPVGAAVPFTIDGRSVVTPYTFETVVGATHSLYAPPRQDITLSDGSIARAAFNGWSTGARASTIRMAVPAAKQATVALNYKRL
jgi:hypothetical protein